MLTLRNERGVGNDPGDEIPYGRGCDDTAVRTTGVSDSDTDPVDVGSDEPQQQDWTESGAEIDAMRNEFDQWRVGFMAANPRVRQVWGSRRHDIEGDSFRAYWQLTVFLDAPGCPCAIGVGDDLDAAGLDALLEASLKVERAKANAAGKVGVTA